MNSSNEVKFDLVIPLFNEERNVEAVIEDIALSGLPSEGLNTLILVNNGSADQTGCLVDALATQYHWIKAVHLKENLNYGGGVYEGFRYTRAPYVAYLPGDGQVSALDLRSLWTHALHFSDLPGSNKLFVKGHRTVRMDGFSTRLASIVYTFLANVFLRIMVRDVNGLPKLFARGLLDLLPNERMATFTFDAQLLATARRNHWKIIERPVTFHARRQGVSSWSQKKFRVYLTTIRQIWRLREIVKRQPAPLLLKDSISSPLGTDSDGSSCATT